MPDFEVHGHVSMSFTAIIEAESAEQAEAIAQDDPVAFFLQALEEGDTPDDSDIEVEFAQAWDG